MLMFELPRRDVETVSFMGMCSWVVWAVWAKRI